MSRLVITILLLVYISITVVGCASQAPKQLKNICEIYKERRGWYKAARRAEQRWDIPQTLLMAFIYQESKFDGKAKPPRKKILGFIPGPRPSNAYGYAQALKGTWRDYQKKSGNHRAKRNDFSDAIDFVGWYNRRSVDHLGIVRHDAYRLYLAYHEGVTGYRRGTYRNKKWLLNVSKRVSRLTKQYQQQYVRCQEELDKSWWRRWFF